MRRVHTKRSIGLVAAALVALVLGGGTGCALWTPAKSSAIQHPWLQLELMIPAGWMVATFSEGLFATYHGLELESIHVRRWDRKVEVKGTSRNLEGELLPYEIAEISLDSRRLDEGVGGLEVLRNAPAEVDGRDCYEIDYRFRGETGLRIRTVEVGCAVDKWIYRFEYRAAEQHYFEAGRSGFEELVQSARFKL